jgi:TfoX/Sxy family transcriptional regulator of competence genes
MASEQRNADYVTEQMSKAGILRNRKMFGDYAIYCDDKVIALFCDDTLFLKATEPGRRALKEVRLGPAYPGAKDSFIISEDEWDDSEYLSTLARITADALPIPKKK